MTSEEFLNILSTASKLKTTQKNAEDNDVEENLFDIWVGTFPEPQKSEWRALLNEMKELQTEEAKIYKALDKLEAVISHNESDIKTWLPLEYELQLVYGKENVQFSPWLQILSRKIDEWTEKKIQEEGDGSRWE